VRFAWRLAAVLLLVTVIVVAAVAWAHGSAAAGPGATIRNGAVFRDRSGPGLNLSNLNDLVRTLVIETCVVARHRRVTRRV
jgi:hypothetical protein